MTDASRPGFLVIHSDEATRRTLNTYLLDLGYDHVHSAAGGADAWYIIKNFDVRLIICAGVLPDMSGLVLLKIVRADASLAKTPFLLVADLVTKGQVIEAGEAGVTDIITRPLNKEAFQKKIEQALRIEADPQDLEFKERYARGVELMNLGKYEDALEVFKSLLEIYESAEIYYNMGYIKTAQGKYEEALLAFRKATQINNAYATAYQKMGEVYAKLGRFEEARKCYELAAEIYMEKQMDASAESVLLEAIKANPQTINVYNTLGIVYRRQGKYQEAIKYYRKALRVTPKDEHIHFNLARVYLDIKNFNEARKVLSQAIQIHPDFVEARNLLESLQMGAGLS
ncbi:MAG: tetratricopeptide repeat protein [Thermodesulfobacteriota bacterium]